MKTCLALILCTTALTAAEPYARFDGPLIDESSGIVKSPTYPDVFWTHNDSGDDPRIFAVRRDGSLIVPEWFRADYPGIRIADAANIDWEDIAVDDAGRLAIGAFGNNGNARRDLALYLLHEPNPHAVLATRFWQQIRFRYPDQDAFPPEQRNFDCEALFFARGKYHLISKNRSEGPAKLYTFDTLDPIEINTVRLAETFAFEGQVTAADYSEDLGLLAVLTYQSIWVFRPQGDRFFGADPIHIPLGNTRQCEAICFDGDTLIVTNEQTDLFEFPIKTE